jgi:hypothetical protein
VIRGHEKPGLKGPFRFPVCHSILRIEYGAWNVFQGAYSIATDRTERVGEFFQRKAWKSLRWGPVGVFLPAKGRRHPPKTGFLGSRMTEKGQIRPKPPATGHWEYRDGIREAKPPPRAPSVNILAQTLVFSSRIDPATQTVAKGDLSYPWPPVSALPPS